MRDIIIKVILLIVIGTFTACDFLDVVPDTDIYVTPKTAYKTEADFENAIMGCYKSFAQTYNDNLLLIPNVMSDESYSTRTTEFSNIAYAQLFNFSQSDIRILWDLWQKSYAALRNVNLLIANIDNANIDASLKSRYKAEAFFLRAYLNFDLVKVWGDIPLELKPLNNSNEALKILRTPQAEVYQAIYTDIDNAISNLPDDHSPMRANVYAAKFLKARVLMYEVKDAFSNDSQALGLLNEITGFELVSDFNTLWNNPDGENSKESIFELQFLAQKELGTMIPYSFSTASYMKGIPVGSTPMGYGNVIPSPVLKELMPSTEDFRMKSTWEYFGTSIGKPVTTTGVCMKFNGLNNTSFVNCCGNNIPLMRYADVLLLKAEINNRLGNSTSTTLAIAQLNEVRIRAGLGSYTEPLTKDEITNFIELERFKELAFEGQRWWDLIRWGKMEAVMSAYNQRVDIISILKNPEPIVTSAHRVFAIPNPVQMNNPGITQNVPFN